MRSRVLGFLYKATRAHVSREFWGVVSSETYRYLQGPDVPPPGYEELIKGPPKLSLLDKEVRTMKGGVNPVAQKT